MEMGTRRGISGEWHLLSVFSFPPCSQHRIAVGNGLLPSMVLRKGAESGIKPQRLRPLWLL